MTFGFSTSSWGSCADVLKPLFLIWAGANHPGKLSFVLLSCRSLLEIQGYSALPGDETETDGSLVPLL